MMDKSFVCIIYDKMHNGIGIVKWKALILSHTLLQANCIVMYYACLECIDYSIMINWGIFPNDLESLFTPVLLNQVHKWCIELEINLLQICLCLKKDKNVAANKNPLMIHLVFPQSWTLWKYHGNFSMPENVMEISSKYIINYYFINKISFLCEVKLACMP